MTQSQIESNGVGKYDEAMKLVGGYTGWAAGAGFIPVPGADIAALTAVQLKMLHSLSKLYDVPFQRNAVKSTVVSLLGSLAPAAAASVTGSLIKAIPVIGTAAGMIAMPGLSVAATYALGRVFARHFEQGGTFLTFDLSAKKQEFAAEVDAARARKPAVA
ncbi:MAG: GTPase [Rhodospirillales bacterium]|nr:GTPase [Rhodospirillales bacterium]